MVEKRTLNPFICASCICVIVIYCGLCKMPSRHPYLSAVALSEVTSVSGVVLSNPSKNYTTGAYTAQFCPNCVKNKEGFVSSGKGCITIKIPSDMAEAYFPGKLYSVCRGKGALLCETGANLILHGTVSNGFFCIKSGKQLQWGNSFSQKIAHFRALCRLQFRRLMYAWGESGGLLLSLLSGARDYTEKNTADAFKNAGLSHILALSGMHLSLVSGIATVFGKKIGGYKIARFLQFTAILLFVWFAGASPSLVRALVCALIMFASSVCGVPSVDMLTVLSVSFLLHAVLLPGDLQNAGFMLSYGALAGILVFSRRIERYLSGIMPLKAASGLAASVSAQTVTAPVSLKLFGSFMPGGIIASVVVSPLVTVFIYGGLVCILLCLCCPLLVKPASVCMRVLYAAIKSSVCAFAQIPGILLD